MSEPFKRECRYVIMKRKDIAAALSADEISALDDMLSRISKYRERHKRAPSLPWAAPPSRPPVRSGRSCSPICVAMMRGRDANIH